MGDGSQRKTTMLRRNRLRLKLGLNRLATATATATATARPSLPILNWTRAKLRRPEGRGWEKAELSSKPTSAALQWCRVNKSNYGHRIEHRVLSVAWGSRISR